MLTNPIQQYIKGQYIMTKGDLSWYLGLIYICKTNNVIHNIKILWGKTYEIWKPKIYMLLCSFSWNISWDLLLNLLIKSWSVSLGSVLFLNFTSLKLWNYSDFINIFVLVFNVSLGISQFYQYFKCIGKKCLHNQY